MGSNMPLDSIAKFRRKGPEWRSRFTHGIREAYKSGPVDYIAQRGVEFNYEVSCRDQGLITNMTGGGFNRGAANPASMKLNALIAMMEHGTIDINVFVEALLDLDRNREKYKGLGVAASLTYVAKALGCVPPCTDAIETEILEDDGILTYRFMMNRPRDQWPNSVEEAGRITVTPELADTLCRETIALMPTAVSPAEIEVTDDKVTLVERVVRTWAFQCTFVIDAMLPVWLVGTSNKRKPKTTRKKGKMQAA